jgi:nicotinamide mononucleotide transporter
MLYILDIDTTMFTVWNYPMSYIEFIGTIFTIWCVWLTARAKVLSWPVGIIGTVLYAFLFYQIQLYSDLIEQVYFLATGFIGWWAWTHPKSAQEANSQRELKIQTNTYKQNIFYGVLLLLGTALLTYVIKNLNVWAPQYFTEPASFPLLDSFTTVMSFLAQWLLIRKRIESWVLWIIVDAIAIGLYWVKGVRFVSLEYVLFFFIASFGLVRWIKEFKKSE